MNRSVPRLGSTAGRLRASRPRNVGAVRMARPIYAGTARSRSSAGASWLAVLGRILAGSVLLVGVALVAPGVLLDTPQPSVQPGQAIVVISGDEQLARFQEGLDLYQRGMGQYLVFSGAAFDNGTSNADVMRQLAVARGVPDRAILEEPLGEDTWGNAIHTRQVLEDHGLRSAILVTSPYHVQRAKLTFDAAYSGSGIELTVHAAPDSEWRKLSWWRQAETRRLTFTELQKLAYIVATGQYH
jgi:uncharacterized SAM-binding protein YcdF (DUF218 family)